MKKRLLAVLCALMLLTSCGMSPEEIVSTMDSANQNYEAGEYSVSQEEIEKLESAYKKMTDEQKEKFDTLKPLVAYAVENIGAINEDFAEVDEYINQKMYYEADGELNEIGQKYKLPPKEQKLFDEKNTDINLGIKNWEIVSSFKEIEIAFNGSDSSKAQSVLGGINVDELTEEQKNTYQEWKNKIEALNMLKTAEAQYNSQKYNSVSKTLKSINTVLLNENQKKMYDDIYSKTIAALEKIKKEEEERKKLTGEKAISLVKARTGSSEISRLGLKYKYYDKGDYYLVCETATKNADGVNKYRVYKSDNTIKFIGCASDWGNGPSEIESEYSE